MPWDCQGGALHHKKGGKWSKKEDTKSHEDCMKKKKWLYANHGKEQNSELAKQLARH